MLLLSVDILGTFVELPPPFLLRSDLVPVYSFGENNAYKQVIFEEGTYWRYLQRRLQKILGFAPCLFHGCGLFFGNSWGLVPYGNPITTIGKFVKANIWLERLM